MATRRQMLATPEIMKTKMHFLPAIAGTIILGAAISSCTNSPKEVPHDNLPEDVKPVAESILNDSPTHFAAAMTYPIERPYPLRNIDDSASMVKYYHTLVDDSLRNKVKESPDTLWQENGWRGWTLDDGNYLWIDGGKVYQINYVSKRETTMLDSLRKEEISSLAPSLRGNWTPVMCVVDSTSGTIFRIDTKEVADSSVYRLAGYRAGQSLSDAPAMVLYGNLTLEGSMGNRFYHFTDSTGVVADYTPDLSADDSVPSMAVERHGKFTKYNARPGYWLDHVKPRPRRR